MLAHWLIRIIALFLLLAPMPVLKGADDFEQTLKPFFSSHCVKCHGGEKVKGMVPCVINVSLTIMVYYHFLKLPQMGKSIFC